ncbi:MAG: hypothetical protein Q8O92_02585 [Candidatus Latescibacter sp.]|nr:hypothetical protein [Candidatus Latescibacter sp.]
MKRTTWWGVLFVLMTAVMGSLSLDACDVPVFRYALERWLPDTYIVYVLFNAPLNKEESAAMELLRSSAGGSGARPNLNVVEVDVSKGMPDDLRPLRDGFQDQSLPCMALRFPEAVGYNRALWRGPLTTENARKLLESPIRRKIAGRIISGDAAVWVLLESGNRKLDDAAADSLNATFAALKKHFLLSSRDIAQKVSAVSQDGSNRSSTAGWKISFPLVRLPRGNADESLLETLLIHSEPDLVEYSTFPMAFPVFGRGRVLYALVGQGITGANISKSCFFMTEGCSCEVKALNPGVDLLMTADWERGIGESWINASETPPLAGLPVIPASGGTEDTLQGAAYAGTSPDSVSKSPAEPGENTLDRLPSAAARKTAEIPGARAASFSLERNIVIAFLVIFLLAVVLTFFIRKRNV